MVPYAIGSRLSAAGRPLKVGLLATDWSQPAWVCTMVEHLVALPCLELHLCLAESAGPARNRGLTRLGRRVHQAYRRWVPDSRQFPLGPAPGPHADETEDLTPWLRGIPVQTLRPLREGGDLDVQDVADIQAEQFDVLIALGIGSWPGAVRSAARWGLWGFQPGDRHAFPGGPAGAWEVVEQAPVTAATLEILGQESDPPVVLRRGATSTCLWSIRSNWNLMYWHGVRWAAQTLHELWRDGETAWAERLVRAAGAVEVPARRVYGPPTSREIRHFVREQRALIDREQELDRTMMRQWILLYAKGSDEPDTRVSQFQRLTPPADRVWADPFVVSHDGRQVVLFEEHILSRKHAHISAMLMEPDGTFGPSRVVLERPYHLSYPFVFEHEGAWYMIPETRGNRSVELYRSLDFPWRWEFQRTLLPEVDAVDATLWEEDGRWWMFVGLQEQRGAYAWTNLHLFHAEDPVRGTWQPHKLNPVVEDVRCARPGGRLYRHQGKLIRPAQDGSVRYGYGLRLNEVIALTPDYYEERPGLFLAPDWADDVCGVHTFNHASDVTFADARILRPRIGAGGDGEP